MHRLHQDGSKGHVTGKSNIRVNSSLAKAMTALDEFRYGFPSGGLSSVTNKWWGSSSSSPVKDSCNDREDSSQGDKSQSDTPKDDKPLEDDTKCEDGNVDKEVDYEGSESLVAIRKRTAEEGREAFKLGTYQRIGSNKLRRRDKALLIQIFKSSLPEDWANGFS